MVIRRLTTTLEGVNETNANIVVNLLNDEKLKGRDKQLRDSGKYLRDNHRQNRVDRILGFFSSRPNWDLPTPSTPGECDPPPLFGSGGDGGPNLDKGTYSIMVL
jgi:hypothetical protein